MDTTRIVTVTALIGCLTYAISASAADTAAGQKTYQAGCNGCHARRLQSFAGKSAADLEKEMNDIVAGTMKHPRKLTLSAGDISNVAAYIVTIAPAK